MNSLVCTRLQEALLAVATASTVASLSLWGSWKIAMLGCFALTILQIYWYRRATRSEADTKFFHIEYMLYNMITLLLFLSGVLDDYYPFKFQLLLIVVVYMTTVMLWCLIILAYKWKSPETHDMHLKYWSCKRCHQSLAIESSNDQRQPLKRHFYSYWLNQCIDNDNYNHYRLLSVFSSILYLLYAHFTLARICNALYLFRLFGELYALPDNCSVAFQTRYHALLCICAFISLEIAIYQMINSFILFNCQRAAMKCIAIVWRIAMMVGTTLLKLCLRLIHFCYCIKDENKVPVYYDQ